jgi:hypothetical protein
MVRIRLAILSNAFSQEGMRRVLVLVTASCAVEIIGSTTVSATFLVSKTGA